MSLTLATVTATAAVIGAVAAGPSRAPAWAAASEATIHPGVQVVTDGAQCTANFVFTDGQGTVYLGMAAHCAGTGGQTDTDGCTTKSLPLGTPVTIKGAQYQGTLAYSSWFSMALAEETDPNACDYNDFAVIKIDPRDVVNVNPSVPSFGGPTGLVDTVATASRVSSYGNSSLRFGLTATSPKHGTSLGQIGNGWQHRIYTATPGIPGDSGSGFLDRTGSAFGVLSTVQLAPYALSNGVADLSRALAYANAHARLGLTLAQGTEPFNG